MLFAASDFVARLVATLEGAGALTGGYALWITLSLLALALLQLALIGLYSPHRQTVGSLGWVGFFLASMGIAFAFFIVLVYAALASPLIPDDPKLLKGAPPSMIVLYFPLFSAGWVLLGAAFLRIPFYPHWAVLLLAAGAVLALHPNPFTTVIFSAGIVVLGLALVMGDPPPNVRPRRYHLPRSGEEGRIARPEGRYSLAPAYFLIGRRVGVRLTLLAQETSDGERAVLAFEEAAAAEAFRVIEGLAPRVGGNKLTPGGTGSSQKRCPGRGEVRRSGSPKRHQAQGRRAEAGLDRDFRGSPHGNVADEFPRRNLLGYS